MQLRFSRSQALEERNRLPIVDSRDEILQAIERSPVVLIRGETGSGKTTQVRLSVVLVGFQLLCSLDRLNCRWYELFESSDCHTGMHIVAYICIWYYFVP